MDWTQFTFVGGAVVAMLMKQFWFKDNTATRDRVLPIIAFAGNFLIRIVSELTGAGDALGFEAAALDDPESLVMYASLADVFGSSLFKMIFVPLVDTLGSWGVHRLKRYRDAWVKATPKKRVR